MTPTVRQAGFKYPVALTAAAWAKCILVPPGVACQDEAGRLWDVAWMLRCAIARCPAGSVVPFALHDRNDNRERAPLARLKAVCGPGAAWPGPRSIGIMSAACYRPVQVP